jgi:hypothetical protein
MEGSQPYYDAMGSELRARQYPAGSILNWRQPFLYSLLAALHSNASLFLLVALSLTLFVEAGRTVKPNVIGVVMIGNVVLPMALDGILGPPVIRYFTELWAGLCIGLSVLSYARNRPIIGAMWGLIALFIRELAAPYAALAAFLAVRGRRWEEVSVWAVGAVCYVMYYTMHSWEALRHMQPGDFTHAGSWLYWGGVTFLLKTWRYNGLLLIAPSWVFGLVVVTMIVACWARDMPAHLRWTVLLYCVLFLAVGQPFNDYWGFLTAPTIALWLAYTPQGFRALLTNAGFSQRSSSQRSGEPTGMGRSRAVRHMLSCHL